MYIEHYTQLCGYLIFENLLSNVLLFEIIWYTLFLSGII